LKKNTVPIKVKKNRVGERVSARLQHAKVAKDRTKHVKPTVSPVLVQHEPQLQAEPCEEDNVPLSELLKSPTTDEKPKTWRGDGIQVRHAILI
jgi:hypothetical protein